MLFTKLSILCLCIRVLTYDSVRLAAKLLLGITLLSHLYTLCGLFTACIPLSTFWELDPIARARRIVIR